MENKIKMVNWDKVGVYLAICGSLFTVIIYMMQMKDETSLSRERIAILETKMEILLGEK